MINKIGNRVSVHVTNRSTIGIRFKRSRPKTDMQGKFMLMEALPNHCDHPQPDNLVEKVCNNRKGYVSLSTALMYLDARHGYWTDICGLASADASVQGDIRRKRVYFFKDEPSRTAVELYIVPFKD